MVTKSSRGLVAHLQITNIKTIIPRVVMMLARKFSTMQINNKKFTLKVMRSLTQARWQAWVVVLTVEKECVKSGRDTWLHRYLLAKSISRRVSYLVKNQRKLQHFAHPMLTKNKLLRLIKIRKL